MRNKRFDRRLSSGETLVESLCAIVLCVLAVLLFTGLIVAASNINRQVQEYDAWNDADIGAAEEQTGLRTPGTVSVRDEDGAACTYPAAYYGGSVRSYEVAE